jgi:pre-mRNA cleavage complex 2 protein Pcf11
MQPMNNFGGGFANRLHFGPGTGKFPTPFEGYGPQHPMNDGLGHFLDRFGSTNPKVVISDVIPTIIRQAQENLASGVLDPNQFSKVMRQVMQLKEQAMMLQADKMHREQSRPRSVGPIPQWNVPNVPRAMNPLHPQQMNAPLKPPVDGMPQKLPVMPPPPPPVPLFAHSVGKRPVSPEVPVVSRDLPLASIDDLEKINADPVSNIEIDKMPRDIRFYGEMATIILGPADVRRISFKVLAHDFSRNVIIDDQIRIKLPIDVQEYVVFPLNGMEHRIKLGAPTRELWVDGKWYQCFFNETTRVRFGANFHKVFLEGPPPNVEIGKVTLNHICAGTVQVIVDGNINDPKTIYLDPKPQRIDIGGKPHIFRFVEGLKTLLINGHPFMAHFGGTPMLIYVNQVKHYIRLTSLPEGVRPGHIHIEGLDPPRAPTSPNQNRPTTCPPSPPTVSTENSQDGMDSSFENKAFDRILSMLPSPSTPRQNKESRRLTSQYSSSPSFEGALKNSGPVTQEMSLPAAPVVKPARVAPEPSVDIHNLWSQLLGAGLIGGPSSAAIPGLEVSASANNASTPKIKKEKVEAVKAIEKAKPVQKPVEPVDLVKPVVLRSHDRTLKR